MQRQSARAAVPCWLPSFLLCLFSCSIGCHAQSGALIPGACGSVTDLRSLTSPHSASTSGESNSHTTSCGGYGNEAIFGIVLQPGGTIEIGQSTNSYDSRHETRWGGDCPGDNVVSCTDDPDDERHSWTNDQSQAQSVFFVVDAYSSGSGSFTLSWSGSDVQGSAGALALAWWGGALYISDASTVTVTRESLSRVVALLFS